MPALPLALDVRADVTPLSMAGPNCSGSLLAVGDRGT
jgi:hypothetical protein